MSTRRDFFRNAAAGVLPFLFRKTETSTETEAKPEGDDVVGKTYVIHCEFPDSGLPKWERKSKEGGA